MHAKVLDFVTYESHWEWHDEQILLPNWSQIEEAIRRLDQFHYPFLHLWPTLDGTHHQLTEDCEWLTLIGGNGEYWFAATIGGRWQNHFINPSGGGEQVQLWSSDQGFAAPDKEVCRDVDVVLNAVRYYAEHGGYDPAIQWIGDEANGPRPVVVTTPCPYCGKPLRSARARQCRHCLTDWHDPSHLQTLGPA